MKGMLACPSRQRVDVLALVKRSHETIEDLGARMYVQVGLDADYIPCCGDDKAKWSDAAIEALGRWKNAILETARRAQLDYLLLADSDILLHPDTVRMLLATERDIVSALFWTYAAWDETGPRWWPNVKPRRLTFPACFEVDWTGGVLLIRGEALKCLRAPWTPREGHWGEDRWFALSCAEQGFQQHCANLGDKSPFHIYKPEDLEAGERTLEAWLALAGTVGA